MQKLLEMYKTSTDIGSAILSFILEGEQGLDMDGLKREVFTIFEGQATFVPRVGPDVGLNSDYQSIGRAISHGYLLIGIFPNTICKVFMAALLAGKDAMSADDYICGLLDHVSEYDSLQLKSARETSTAAGVFSEETSTFPLDFASEYGVVRIPTPSSLRGILVIVAKTELIAKPSVALNEIRAGMFEGKFHKLWGNIRKAEVDYLYDKMRLTTSKFLKMLRVNEYAG